MKFKFKIAILIFAIHLLTVLCFAGEIYIDREIKPKLIELITNAKQSIDIEVFILSDWDVIKALKRASSRGIKVRIILDPIVRENHYTFDKFLDSSAEIRFYHIRRPAIFHRKFILIDNKTLLIGSSNFSYNGLENNKEIMVKITDGKIVDSIRKIFNEDYW
jgi:phosphatidylserine/phosphatidylglycerophosphate/cardiolipin synthase-like enzyme